MNEDINILTEIHKGAKIGMYSIDQVLNKVGDKTMRDNLLYQYNLYSDTLNNVDYEFDKIGYRPEYDLTKVKIMNWFGVNFNTMNDKSNSKIAEILIQGNTMGIIEGRKLLNNNPNSNESIKNILYNFVTMQENTVEQLKKFL